MCFLNEGAPRLGPGQKYQPNSIEINFIRQERNKSLFTTLGNAAIGSLVTLGIYLHFPMFIFFFAILRETKKFATKKNKRESEREREREREGEKETKP